MGKWDPTTYGVDDALRDMLCDGNVKDVAFTENGVIKEYNDGHCSLYEKADNEKGHLSCDFRWDDDGKCTATPHSTN